MVKNDYLIVLQIGMALITIYLGIKIYICFETQNEVSELEHKVEKLEEQIEELKRSSSKSK